MPKLLTRYIIKANGKVIDHAFDKKKANVIAGNYAEHCANMDDPWFPKMEVNIETVESE